MAIIMVMITVALVAGLAAATVTLIDAGITRRMGSHDQIRANLIMQGAVDRVRGILAQDLQTGNVDHLGEPWAVANIALPLAQEEGKAEVSVFDQAGRINLNNLIRDNTDDKEEIARFLRLLRILGISEADSWQLVTALLDWLDADDVPRQGGAESQWYANLSTPVQAANGPLVVIDELASIRGFTPELLRRLAPFVTALPSATPVNVNTAPAEVLAACIPELSLQGAKQLITERQRAWFKDVPDFNARLGSLNLAGNPTQIAVDSRYFLAAIRVRYGIALIRSEVLLERAPKGALILWQRRL